MPTEPLAAVADAARDACGTDRDEIRSAHRALRESQRAHDHEVREAERHVAVARREGGDAAAEAQRRLEECRSNRRDVDEAWPVLHALTDVIEDDEQVFDMTTAVSAGHDGVLVTTDRRLLFFAPRRRLEIPFARLRSVTSSGRRFGSRLVIKTADGREVLGGLSRERADELSELVCARVSRAMA